MKCLLAVMLLATCAAAQQQPSGSCSAGQSKNGSVCKGPIVQKTPGSPKASLIQPPVSTWEHPRQAVDYQQQIQLRDQTTFTLTPAVSQTTSLSTYAPPPQLTPLHQTSDDFYSTAGFPVGAAISREVRLHRARAFVKKFCKYSGSGAVWSYEFASGERIEGVCE